MYFKLQVAIFVVESTNSRMITILTYFPFPSFLNMNNRWALICFLSACAAVLCKSNAINEPKHLLANAVILRSISGELCCNEKIF